MAPSKAPNSWEDSDEESTPPSSPPAVAARRGKFDDEEDDSDVLESWDAAEDSEAEREKAKKAAEEKAKAEAAAKASHKSKSQRIEERRQENMRRRQQEEESSEEEEDDATKRARLREEEKAADMKHSEDLFGGAGSGPAKRSTTKAAVVQEGDDPTKTIDLNSLKLFDPTTVQQFADLRETLTPTLMKNSKKAHYALFLQEFSKQLARDLNSDQLKKMSSAFATMSNEKLKEEKAADKGGKKTKAAKTKTSLSANRDLASKADTTLYDDGGLDE